MSKGSINVSIENIFPLIKKFLYSDHEIFLRELISNATDASLKLKHLVAIGEAKAIDLSDLKIEVKLDREGSKIHIIDQGVGMSREEVEKYINQVAFSGAQEFINRHKDTQGDSGIIGHFGLGFYAAFMVTESVEILTKSYKKDVPAVKWVCDGSPEYEMEEIEKEEIGTEIILHISEDSKEFLEKQKISELLQKYNRFNQIPIKFGTKKINDPNFNPKTIKDKDEKEIKEPHKQIEVDNIVNDTTPAWTKKPSELKEEDYKNFYRALYPMQFEDPLFNIHLNVDYPFNLTGILYFPKLSKTMDLQRDRIQLYQNQVFVTDNVEGIVPDFLQMLRGVVDSNDIPLNVSRSYLQADAAVKKISGYITKKVADKLKDIYKEDRKTFESYWDDIKVIIQYAMLSDDKFFEKANEFVLYSTVEGKYLTLEEMKTKFKDAQTDKDGKLIILYAFDKEKQHGFIESARAKGYKVLVLNSPIISHLIQKLETSNEKISFVRVDADVVDNLIKKNENVPSKISDEDKEKLKKIIEKSIAEQNYTVQLEAMDSLESLFVITVPEFMRRMKEMSASGGNVMFGMNSMPDMYNLIVNVNHKLLSLILEAEEEEQKRIIFQAFDLAKLSQNLLQGEALTKFINRSYDLIK